MDLPALQLAHTAALVAAARLRLPLRSGLAQGDDHALMRLGSWPGPHFPRRRGRTRDEHPARTGHAVSLEALALLGVSGFPVTHIGQELLDLGCDLLTRGHVSTRGQLRPRC